MSNLDAIGCLRENDPCKSICAVCMADQYAPNPPHVTTLYRFYDSSDQLLYIGISKNWPSRLSGHKISQPWWAQVDHIKLEHFPDRKSAEIAEVIAIRSETPRWNRMHNQVDTLYPDRDCRVCGSDFTDGKRHAHVEVIV